MASAKVNKINGPQKEGTKITSVSAYIDILKKKFLGKEFFYTLKVFEKEIFFIFKEYRDDKAMLETFCLRFFERVEKSILERVKVSDYGEKELVSIFTNFFEQKKFQKNPFIAKEISKGIKQIKEAVKLAWLEEDFNDRTNMPFSQFFFRGHADKSWLLKPSVFRGQYDERFFYHEMQRLEPGVFKNNSVFDNLALMQHYACPTRLLDVSFNPLVSLYFACKEEKDKDGLVYIFNRIDFANEDDADVSALSKLALLNGKQKLELKKDLKNNALNENGYYAQIMNKLDFVKEYFLEPVLVKSKFLAPRIKQQAGAFVIAPFDDQKVEDFMKSICCGSILIPATAKDDILQELDQLCVNEAYLFDGLEHSVNYLKNKRK